MFKKMDSSDVSLVRRAQAGDGSAFNILVCKYRRRILQLTRRYARNEADAEDLVQDTFIKAYRALPNFRGEAAFYSWLHRIAINAANTAFAMRARDVNFVSPNASDAAAMEELDTPEDLAVTDELFVVLNSALAALCEEQRQALMLCAIDGLSYREVAAAMRCPVGTVRSRVFRARETIHLRVKSIFDEGLGRARGKSNARSWRSASAVYA